MLLWLLLLCSALLAAVPSPASGGGVRGTFTLPAPADISAALFDIDTGEQLQTLLVATPHAKGTHTLSSEHPLAIERPERVELRVVAHKTAYNWDGVIANTGPQIGPSVYRALDTFCDLSCGGEVCSFALCYNEGSKPFGLFKRSAPQMPELLGHDDYHTAFSLTATDGQVAYYANTAIQADIPGYYHRPTTFVVGVDVATGCAHNFTVGGKQFCEEGYGQPEGSCANPEWDGCNGGDQHWASVLDLTNNTATVPSACDNTTEQGLMLSCCNSHAPKQSGCTYAGAATGLAVQSQGELLIVASGHQGKITAYHKTTGELRHSWQMPIEHYPFGMWKVAVDPTSSDHLWLSAEGLGVVKLSGLTGNAALAVALALAGVEHPGNVAVSAKGEVLVADRGTQQFKLFSAAGSLEHSYGKPGGYSVGPPDVSTDRFWFFPASTPGENGGSGGAPVAFTNDADGTIWVGDPGNKRMVQLARDGSQLDEVLFIPRSYKAATDFTNVSRVFCNMLEFSCDYSKPINESWQLVRNWAAGVNSSYASADYGTGLDLWPTSGFTDVVTLPSGHTVGMIPELFPNWPHNSSNSFAQVVELRDDGMHVLLHLAKGQCSMTASGSLRTLVTHTEGASMWQEAFEAKPVVDRDTGAITWGDLPGVLLASFNVTRASLAARGSMAAARVPSTDSGLLVVFDASTGKPQKGASDGCGMSCNAGMHLGVVDLTDGSSGFKWSASPFGTWNASYSDWQTFQPGNVSMKVMQIHEPAGVWGGNDTGVGYAGSTPMTLGDHTVIVGFYGEGWKGCEANQFLHYHAQTGVFLGQFGTPNCFQRRDSAQQYAVAGAAGNSFSPTLVKAPVAADEAYLWHQDESGHGGLHRWHLTGLDSIAAVSVSMEEERPPITRLNINVRDYGAVGDGRTDDSDAFRKALLVASKAASATVSVPGPFRFVVANISLSANVRLVGTVQAAIVEDAPGTTGAPPGSPVIMMPASAVFAVQLNFSTSVKGIRFEGSPNDRHSALQNGFIHSPRVSNVVVERCSFADTSRGGIVTDHTHDFAFLDNLIENVGEGMDIQFSHNGVVAGNVLHNITQHGIQFWGNFNNKVQDSTNLTFAHNVVRNVSHGADIWGTGAVGVAFESNVVDGAGDVALDCEWCTDVVFRNNSVRNGRNAGISLFLSCKNVSITDNSIWMWENEADDTGLGYGIWLTGTDKKKVPSDLGHHNVSIAGNTIFALGSRSTPAKFGKGKGKHAVAVQSGTLISLGHNVLNNDTDVLLDVDIQ
jgi:hypothetical protein